MEDKKELERVKRELEDLKKNVKKVERDVYSPEAQKAFKEYQGTIEQFERERQLRQVASGRKETGKSKFLSFLAAAAFGDRDIAEEIRTKYQERYSKEEIEEAKKTLEKEFGVKKKKDTDALNVRKFRKVVKDEISPINESIAGITASVSTVAKDIQRANKSIKSISDNLVGTINKTLMALAGGRGDLDRTPDKMKPVSVADEEGKEYLFYPDAPSGRQLYEKSKTGTAGRIASKEVQRELDSEIKRLSQESALRPVRAGTGDVVGDDLLDRIKVLLEEESMFRKRDMEKLVEDLKQRISEKKTSSVFDSESDEQQRVLTNSLEKALETIIARNPDLFKSSNAPINVDTDFDGDRRRRGRGNPPTRPSPGPNVPTPDVPGKTPKTPTPPMPDVPGTTPKTPSVPDDKLKFGDKLKNFIRNIPKPSLTGLGGRTALLLGGVAVAATAATASIFGAIDYGMKSSADKNIRKIIESGSVSDIATALQAGSPQQRAYKLQEFRKIASENPELQKKLVEAETIAGYTGLKPQDVLENKTIPKQKEVKNDLSISPARDIGGQQIIDQNQKRIDIQSAEKVEIPAQTVNNINSTQVIPVPSNKKTIDIHNSENTFNRLLAQDFDHPATYSTMNMG